MIRFVCECGKQLQARDENAGKAVLCPACKRQLTVPDAGPSPVAIQPEEPVVRPSAEPRVQKSRPAYRDDREDERDEDVDDRPRRRPREGGSSGKAIASLVLGILSLCGCVFLTGIPSILLGILSLRDIGRSAGAMTGKPLAIIGLTLGSIGTLCCSVGYFFLLIMPATDRVREAAARTESTNNLKQMGIAMHNYNDTYMKLPPSGVGDPMQPEMQRKPNLSWRVAILPFIEQNNLYRQFKFNEPWDSPNNIKLLGQMPKIYKLPGDEKTKSDHTHYQMFVGNGAFEKTRSLSIPQDFQDGTSNTIMIVEAEQAVPWTKPEDIPFDPNRPIRPLLSTHFSRGANAVLVDGSVRVLDKSISENTLKLAITRNDGMPLGFDW